MRIPAGWGNNRYKESKENRCIWREMKGTLSLRAVNFSDFFEFEGGNIPFCEIRILLRLTVYRRWIISSIRGFYGIYARRFNNLWANGRKLLLKYWVLGRSGEIILSNRAVNYVKVWVLGRSLIKKASFLCIECACVLLEAFCGLNCSENEDYTW